jgi:hypothetical protein
LDVSILSFKVLSFSLADVFIGEMVPRAVRVPAREKLGSPKLKKGPPPLHRAIMLRRNVAPKV